MRKPWHCPYCKLASTRRSNISAHIERKHPGFYNPMPGLKQNRPFNSYFSQPQNRSSNPPFSYFSQPQNQSSIGYLTQDNFSDRLQIIEKSTRFRNILNEIRQMNAMEIALLLQGINNLPNFRSYCDGYSNF